MMIQWNKALKGVDLFQAILTLKTADEVERFLKDLLTPQEIRALKERFEVCQLLAKGQSYRQIREATGASLTTITRVARFLNEESYQGYKLVLNRIKG